MGILDERIAQMKREIIAELGAEKSDRDRLFEVAKAALQGNLSYYGVGTLQDDLTTNYKSCAENAFNIATAFMTEFNRLTGEK